MRREQKIANGAVPEFFCRIPHPETVAGRLGHFTVIHVDIAVVQPEAGQRRAGGALTLGNLVLVMRECEVLSAAVDIDVGTEILAHHR